MKFALMAIVLALLMIFAGLVLAGCEESAPAGQTGIEVDVDIDRSQPRPTLHKPKAPKAGKR